MEELSLHLRLSKCQFAVPEVEYLGMIIQPNKIAMDPVKLDGITAWPTPTKLKEVCSFLGFANYYQRFIPEYSSVACPLIDLTKKDHPWEWTPTCQKAFDNLKALFLKQPVLHIPNPNTPFTITTDTSKFASGGVLLQADENEDWHPCSYLSNSFLPAERNYDIYDQELLAVINALNAWHHYLRKFPFPVQVFTDHKNLTYFHQAQHLNRRQACWLVDLADFNLKFTHIPGTSLTGPDALSQRPDLCFDTTDDNSEITLLLETMFVWIIDCTLATPESEMKCRQSKVCTKKRRTLHHHRRSIPDHLPPSPFTDLEYPPSLPCLPLTVNEHKDT